MPPKLQQLSGSVSRRGFILGAVATGALAACGSDTPSESSASVSAGSSPDLADADEQLFTLVQRSPQNVNVPGSIRLPISLSTGAAVLIQDGPETLVAQVTTLEGTPVGGPISAIRRDVEPGPYYAFRPEIDEVGFYFLNVEGGPVDGSAFEITTPELVTVPIPGEAMPAFDTPTTANPSGVDPLCTREPEPCPFHDISLSEALAGDKPVVYLIGTPAFCQTGSCAPALESMIDVQDQFGDTFTFVHAEVFTDDKATTPAPAVAAAGLTYEPALFITDADGIVVERLDGVWDKTELVEVLTSAAG